MATPVTSAIDRFFDRVDGNVAAFARLLGRMQTSMRLARGPVVQISEALDAQTGRPVFVVTAGRTRVECPTREAADCVRRGLEAVA